MVYNRGDALVLRENLIKRFNEIGEARTKIRVLMQKVEGMARDIPSDLEGLPIATEKVNAVWDKLKADGVALNV